MKNQPFSSLPEPHQQLVRLMQQIGFGRIENLRVQDGLPVFDPPPRVVEDVKVTADNGPRQQLVYGEFVLKQSVIDLVAQFARVRNGVVESLLVRHGLPFSMSVEVAVLAACTIVP